MTRPQDDNLGGEFFSFNDIVKKGAGSMWKYAILLLMSLGVSNIGGWVYLIALNLIVLQETGSPLAVGLLYILAPIAALLTNAWSGSLIDRTNTRRLMIVLDVIRAALIILIPLLSSIIYIYCVVLVVNLANAISQPASTVYITKLIPKENRQRFNALRGFIHSSGTMLGPAIAGFLFFVGSPFMAIYLNGASLLFSALLLLLLPVVDAPIERTKSTRRFEQIQADIKTVVSYCKRSVYVFYVYGLFVLVTVFMTAIDSLEASFAKIELLLTDAEYGFLLSFFGVGIIVGSLINVRFAKSLKVETLIGYGTVMTAVAYVTLYVATDQVVAIIGVTLIGFFVTFLNTGYLTFYQNAVPTSLMGRFMSLFGLVEALAIIFFTVVFGIMANVIGIRPVGLVGSVLFFIVGIAAIRVTKRKNRHSVVRNDESMDYE
ncbi:permease [Bacillaceae bacterium JMAK1]|nr:permease [Bacillaceae bacterium JMAK1]